MNLGTRWYLYLDPSRIQKTNLFLVDFMLVVGCHHVYNESGDSICGLDSEIYEHISSVP